MSMGVKDVYMQIDGLSAMKMAESLCKIDRRSGGFRGSGRVLSFARRYAKFEPFELEYSDGKQGPPAIAFGDPFTSELVISAHYDTIGTGGCDNTSGVVAVVIAASRWESPPESVSFVLTPREEPPYFQSKLMGTNAMLSMMGGREPKMMIAVDTIGGMKSMGQRSVEFCGSDESLAALPRDIVEDAVCGLRDLHRLSDARNFKNGVLLTDQMVLRVPMHTDHDTVDKVDWDFVVSVARRINRLVPETSVIATEERHDEDDEVNG